MQSFPPRLPSTLNDVRLVAPKPIFTRFAFDIHFYPFPPFLATNRIVTASILQESSGERRDRLFV
jgi:hypothetical protein